MRNCSHRSSSRGSQARVPPVCHRFPQAGSSKAKTCTSGNAQMPSCKSSEHSYSSHKEKIWQPKISCCLPRISSLTVAKRQRNGSGTKDLTPDTQHAQDTYVSALTPRRVLTASPWVLPPSRGVLCPSGHGVREFTALPLLSCCDRLFPCEGVGGSACTCYR